MKIRRSGLIPRVVCAAPNKNFFWAGGQLAIRAHVNPSLPPGLSTPSHSPGADCRFQVLQHLDFTGGARSSLQRAACTTFSISLVSPLSRFLRLRHLPTSEMSSPRDSPKTKTSKESHKDLRKGSVALGGADSPPPEKSKSKDSNKSHKKGTITPVIISGASTALMQGSGQTRPLPAHAGIQFDSFEKTFTSKTVSRDPLPALVTWPQDDIVVEEQKRKLRTSKPTLPVRLRNGLLCVCRWVDLQSRLFR